MAQETQEPKTEVMKLGQDMDPVDREALNKAVAKATKEGMAEEPQVTEEEQPEEEQEKHTCARCGYTEGDVTPPQEDLAEYMRSILGSCRFTKGYDLMKGQIKVLFTTVDVDASERINQIVERLGALEDPIAFRAYATRMHMVYFMQEYTLGPDTSKFEVSMAKTPEEINTDFKERFGTVDESVMQMFTRAMATFVSLKNALIDACFDEAFYKGAGPF